MGRMTARRRCQAAAPKKAGEATATGWERKPRAGQGFQMDWRRAVLVGYSAVKRPRQRVQAATV